jgi:hypothetical protein
LIIVETQILKRARKMAADCIRQADQRNTSKRDVVADYLQRWAITAFCGTEPFKDIWLWWMLPMLPDPDGFANSS